MVICATPGCGTPGRPLPACDLCHQRHYCGSHCLIPITQADIDDEVVRRQNHCLEQQSSANDNNALQQENDTNHDDNDDKRKKDLIQNTALIAHQLGVHSGQTICPPCWKKIFSSDG